MEGYRMTLPADVSGIISRLEQQGYEAYAVGGCVRDTMLHKQPEDWDITTSARPQEVKALFTKTIDTGIQHGTVTVMLHGTGYEVTTYRIDGEYEDGRHPKNVAYTTELSMDLERRDFTINAMAYNDRSGLVDLFGGALDLQRKILRCVGDAGERFDEDALRMLRAVRFAGQLDLTIEEATRNAIGQRAEKLGQISAERIRVELTKLLQSPGAEWIRDAYEMGMTKVFLPELDRMMSCEQQNHHHIYTVGEHSIRTVVWMNRFFSCTCESADGLEENAGDAGKNPEESRLKQAGKESEENRLKQAEKGSEENCLKQIGKDYEENRLRQAGKGSEENCLKQIGKDYEENRLKQTGKGSEENCLKQVGKDSEESRFRLVGEEMKKVLSAKAIEFIRRNVRSLNEKQHQILVVTMLLHDVGKPDRKTIDEAGTGHFYGHPEKGAEIARGILKRLTYDNDTVDTAVRLIRYHDYRMEPTIKAVRRAASRIGKDIMPMLLLVQYADILAQNPSTYDEKLPVLDQAAELYEQIALEKQPVSVKELVVNGRDLMELGVSPGPAMGQILQRLLEVVLDDPSKNERETLLQLVKTEKI